ncbi:MAG: beta-ketoacyl synthase chain length factor, partial [Gammaproteobacteria bacterium]|nr:beta-ketoacyl synthase chain length factor [Gammaproteobacteria bacterium]
MFIQSIGIVGSGFNNWQQAKAILNNDGSFVPDQTDKYKITILKPNEARRTSTTIKIALQTAEETLSNSSFTADQLFSVFVSSDGDPNILQSICEELSTDDKFVSPTQFHNSVHNAPAGYWSIGQQSMQGINSIACGDCSVAGALIEADSLLQTGENAVLVVCFDIKSPTPLDSARTIKYSLSSSMILTRKATTESLFSIELDIQPVKSNRITLMTDPVLEKLRIDSPTSRGLPLLQTL